MRATFESSSIGSLLLLALVAIMLSQQAQAQIDAEMELVELCPGILLEAAEPFELTEPERILVCRGVGREPYQDVPWNQQRFFLRNFLNDRGFFRFQVDRDQKGQVHIKLGRRSVIRDVTLIGAPFDLRPHRFWQIYGRPMTPGALDRLENWLKLELSRAGYPCIELDTRAFPLSDELVINLAQPAAMRFSNIEMELIPGTIGGVERRYLAFERDDPYNSLLIDLSVQRMINDELVISANYNLRCEPEDQTVAVRINNIAGKPRLVSLGLGFDTEEFFMIEGGWRNNRLGEMASQLEASARASFREQRAFLGFDWYYAPMVIRHSIRSQLLVERSNEPNFESTRYEVRSGPSWAWDQSPHAFDLWTSVAYDHVETLRGEGPRLARAMLFRLDLSLQTHDFEYFRLDPRQGYRLNASTELSSKSFGADYTSTRYSFSGTHLWNLFNLEPAIWILGLRGHATTVELGSDTDETEYPTNRRLRLGGSQNLRGFARQKLPGDGALSSAYLGSELRISQIFPYGIQPILFFDVGRFGSDSFRLENSNFWSPGIGVHWATFIGTFRASIAHGYASGDLADQFSHLARWQAYLSYGEQF